MIFVGGVFLISVRGGISYEFSLPLFRHHCRTNLLGNILNVHIINKVFERRKVHCRAVRRVNTVIYGYVAAVVFGEEKLHITACFLVVATETRQVFGYNAVYRAVLNVRKHFLKTRSFRCHSAPPVVNVLGIVVETVFAAISNEHFTLILYAGAFAIHTVIAAQTQIQCDIIK